ncbi:SAM-dependent methyltransferase [Sphingomonas sp. PAMC 26621]|uniref:SAM-dependent methyltransferase n=1 Tax=Sphingomonas sp. PAMC 26621 TaxID=1112213 RepID=UPI000287FEEB|nr:cyclopropane-fatty-acyl-phospholipid synthase family protein [Sphingomonas sp. PAMC 26621]
MWLFDRFARNLVKRGALTIIDADGKHYHYGTPDRMFEPCTIRFVDPKVASYIARHPRLGAALAWMDGRLLVEQGDIAGLIDLIRGNAVWEDGKSSLGTRNPFKLAWATATAQIRQLNRIAKSKQNVAHHYDIGDRLYDLFLDADLQYSCAYFTDADNTLEQAQYDKKVHIAAKLALKPGLRVLDIGCGWGGMALYLNRVADVDVLGITLSKEQLKTARQRAEDAGVADRVKFELIDYRQMTGRFDRIVSVGMFEHVGVPNYRRFFHKCRALLADDGVMLLHTIGRMGGPGQTDPFTARYIFPGGYNPALSEIVGASESVRLITADVETLRLHYAMTIRHWYDRTVASREKIEGMFDARFYRMWTFYLAGAMAAFKHGVMCNYQVQMIRNRRALPVTRGYITTTEQELTAPD